jgi:hypothetical protein
MKKNMGGADKLVRLVVALLMILAYFQGLVKETLGIVLLGIAFIFIVTSLFSFCPLYAIFGISSCPAKKNK